MPAAQLSIRRHSSDRFAVSLTPPVSMAAAWVPAYPVALTHTELDDLTAALNRIVSAFAQGASQSTVESLSVFGRLLAKQFLPDPIRQALNRLPPPVPLCILTNAPEIPWELLCPGEQVLALMRPVSRQYLDEQRWDAHVYERWQSGLNAAQTATPALLLIANPSGDLDASDGEAARILDVIDTLPWYMRCTAIFREQANRATLLAEVSAGAYTIIHYSGHADMQATTAAPQGLRLADGHLLPQQLASALSGTPLVFFNACGTSEAGAGQELLNACLRAGVRGCIGTLWPISDLASVDFGATFYQSLLAGQPVGEALWQARRIVAATQPQDPTWAAFVLYADPEWRPIPPPDQTTYLATVLALRLGHTADRIDETDQPHITVDALKRLAAVVNDWAGQVCRLGPDGLLATFGIPAAQEDQAQRALYAALALRTAAEQFALRPVIAVTTGSVEKHIGFSSFPGEVITGPAVSGALALCQDAAPAEILADLATYQASTDQFEWAQHNRHTQRLAGIRPVELSSPASIPLVGREAELDTLVVYWRRCQAQQQRHLVGLVGEAGIGKTRLLHAFHQTLQAKPEEPLLLWLGVRCPAYLKRAPFALLRALLAKGLGVDANAPAEVWRQALAHLLAGETPSAVDLPLLEQSLGLQPAFSEGRDVAESVRRGQLMAVFKMLLTHISHRAPLILAIDDIYQADEPSLDIVNQLIDSLEAVPLLWLLVYRREWLPPWANKRRCHTLDLDELDAAARTQLLAALLPANVPAAIEKVILERAGGNPLYLDQLARVVRDAVAEVGSISGVGPATLPSTLRLTVQARATQLPAVSQAILKLAAVAGSPFAPALLAAVLNQTGEAANLEPALRELVGHDFLRAAATNYSFYHPLIEEVIYAELPSGERQTLHRRLADALSERDAPPGVVLPALVAWHRLRSVTRSQPDGSWVISPPPFGPRYLTQVTDDLAAASEAAWQSYANHEVVRWCQAGLELLPHLTAAESTPAAVVFQAGMGQALSRLGEFEIATHHLQEAFEGCLSIAGGAGRHLQLADLARQIGRLRMRQGHYAEGLAWMGRGQELAGAGVGAQAEAMQALIEVHSGAVYHWQGNLDQAAQHYQAGISLAERLSDSFISALAEGCNGLGVICDERGQVEQAIIYFTRALETWRTLGDRYEATRVQINLGNAYFYRSDWLSAQEHYQQSLTFWEQIEDRHHIAFSLLNLGGVHLCQGRWAEAEACYTQAQQLWTAVGEVRMEALAHLNLGRLALARLNLPAAHVHLDHALDILDQQAVDSFRAEAYATLAELYLQENAPEQTLKWAERALATAQRQALRLEQGIAHRLIGQAYQRQAHYALALQHLQQSVEELAATPNRHELGRTWVALALLEEAMGQVEQAQTRLDEAAALFTALGAQPDWEQVQMMRRGGKP